MDDVEALAALALEIRHSGGRRCRTCLNYEAQPFCGMTGRPHPPVLPMAPSVGGASVPSQSTNGSGNLCSDTLDLSQLMPAQHHSDRRRKKHAVHRHRPRTPPAPPPPPPTTRAFPLSDDVLFVVYGMLMPWEMVAVRTLSKTLWATSLHPAVWRQHMAAVEQVRLIRLPAAFHSDDVAGIWQRGVRSFISSVLDGRSPLDMPESLHRVVGHREYAACVGSGIPGLWRLVERIFPAPLSGVKDAVACDLLRAVQDMTMAESSLQELAMTDLDELHELLSRLCDAHTTLAEAHTLLRQHKLNAPGTLAPLHAYVKSWQGTLNFLTKVDQWMNCVTKLRYWRLLRSQFGSLPETPSLCPVRLIMTMFREGVPNFREAWDAIVMSAADAFEEALSPITESEAKSPFSVTEPGEAFFQGSPPPVGPNAPVFPIPGEETGTNTDGTSVATVMPSSEGDPWHN